MQRINQQRQLTCPIDMTDMFRALEREAPHMSTTMLLEHCALSATQGGQRYASIYATTGAHDMHHQQRQDNDPMRAFQHREGRDVVGFLSYEAARFVDAIDLPTSDTAPQSVLFTPEISIVLDRETRVITVEHDAHISIDIDRIIAEAMRSRYSSAPSMPSLPTIDTSSILQRTLSPSAYHEKVRRAQACIQAGEAFQIVLSQELCGSPGASPLDVYAALRSINPSPYHFCLRTPDFTLVGASPETLIRTEGDSLLYRPIAGTRRRSSDPAEDARLQEELLHDPKEIAEHHMLVDLGRNDLGRVSQYGSVTVHNAFRIEKFAHVQHIVSDVRGTLRPDCSSLDALRAVFPAGTLTGAPKLRAMEIIRDLEQSPRGFYGGAIGTMRANGDADFAIVIRTMMFQHDAVTLRVGAGIVADSDPVKEDEECMFKAKSCLMALAAASPALCHAH